MRTAVAYLRTAGPEADGRRQREILNRWAEREQIAIVAYYSDMGICGRSAPGERAGFLTALARLQPDQLLVVVSVDRISRSPAEVARWASWLTRRGSELRCPSIDLRLWLAIWDHRQSAAAVPAAG